MIPEAIKRSQIVVVRQHRKAADQQPQYGACHQIDRLDRTSIENARACPCHGERSEKQGVGKVDADQIGDLPVHSEQRNRGKPQQDAQSPTSRPREAPNSAPRRKAAAGRGWPLRRSSRETACGGRGSSLEVVSSVSAPASSSTGPGKELMNADVCAPGYAPVWFQRPFQDPCNRR